MLNIKLSPAQALVLQAIETALIGAAITAFVAGAQYLGNNEHVDLRDLGILIGMTFIMAAYSALSAYTKAHFSQVAQAAQDAIQQVQAAQAQGAAPAAPLVTIHAAAPVSVEQPAPVSVPAPASKPAQPAPAIVPQATGPVPAANFDFS